MMAMKVFLRLVVGTLLLVVLCCCDHYNIVPASPMSCDSEPCLTIDQFVETVNLSNSDDLQLLFCDGEHILTQKMTLQSMNKVELRGCTQYVHFIAQNHLVLTGVKNVLIENLIFTRGRNHPVLLENAHNVLLIHCVFTKFTERALHIKGTRNTSLQTVQFLENMIGNLKIDYPNEKYLAIINIYSTYISMINCKAISNNATYNNYGFHFCSDELSIISSHFIGNRILKMNQFLHIICNKSVDVSNSTFKRNLAITGSIIKIEPIKPRQCILYNISVSFTNCDFISNDAFGGSSILRVENVRLTRMMDNLFTRNSGVATHILNHTQLLMANNRYEANQAKAHDTIFSSGLVVLLQIDELNITSSNFINNQLVNIQGAETFGMIINIKKCAHVNILNISFDNNQGHFYTKKSKIQLRELIIFTNNEGGAVYAEQCEIHCNSKARIIIRNNTAKFGGGIFLRESILVIKSPIVMSQNKAKFGGGICAYKSTIKFSQAPNENSKMVESFIKDNFADMNGGGVYILSSTLKITYRAYVSINSNMAKNNGGGIYLDHSSGIYLYKEECEKFLNYKQIHVKLNVTNNSAQKGGGLFVADKTVGRIFCEGYDNREQDGILSPECFFQIIKIVDPLKSCSQVDINYVNLFFMNNTASSSGWAIYGGLLDRCTIDPAAEILAAHRQGFDSSHINSHSNGMKYMQLISTINQSLVSSDPVQLLFCHVQPHSKNISIHTRKGETFTIKIMAVDQAGHAVAAEVRGFVTTRLGQLKEGQDIYNVSKYCTEVEYNVFSRDSYTQVELYADGPCSNIGISKAIMYISFLPCKCPIGLRPSSLSECKCVCDPVLSRYHITNCSHELGTIQIDSNMWIGATNTTNGTFYIVHQCVFDYCIEQRPIHISLNSSTERDRQCAHNRSGVLCGQCEEGLSLVLASSKCQECSNIYLLLLIPFALTGIALVVFVLLLNITIAAGTINGLIIYANLLTASPLHFVERNFLTTFISWVNLDLGIETCFYSGMDSQAKVLLQLVFPAYLFLLLFLIIKLSKHSSTFAKILSSRNPVAALCTLFLLSYSKLVRFMVVALQSVVFKTSSGSRETMWLYNPNVSYFTLSHLPRFIAAAVIFTAGGVFTLLLLFGQWFSNCGSWRVMRWTKNTKYTAFMDAYHAPFTPKHRYWVGLLLFALIIHNAVAAYVSDDFLSSLSAGCIGVSIMAWKVINNRVFKNWLNSVLETFYLMNLIILACGILYTKSNPSMKQTAKQLVNASMALAFLEFVAILCYHTHKYVLSRSKMWPVQIVHNVTRIFMEMKQNRNGIEMRQILNKKDGEDLESPSYAGIRMLDALAPLNEDDYKPPPVPKSDPQVVTHTVVEIHHERPTTE